MPIQIKAKSNSNEHHSADINTLIYYNSKIYSGADDGKIIVWDKDLKKLKEVEAHPTTVYCLSVGNNTLYSCSNDGALKCWNLDSLEYKGKLLQVDEELYRLTFSDGILYSSDHNGNIRSLDADGVVKGLYALLEPLRELIVKNKCIYTVRDLDLVVTEIKGEKLFEVKTVLSGRAPICLAGNKLCFSSRGGRDILITENSGKFQIVCEVKDAHELIINSLIAITANDNTYLYSGGWDKTLKRWKIENSTCNLEDSCNIEAVINTMTNGEKGVVYVGCDNGGIVRIDG